MTQKQRLLTHDSGYPAQMRYNWGYAPWVIESWAKQSKETGADKRAAIIKQNILQHIKKSKENRIMSVIQEEFNYVVARKWAPDDPITDLCIYTYGHQIQKGTLADAQRFLEYVQSGADEKEEYHIYKVSYEKLT
jgi:hypothetical protein